MTNSPNMRRTNAKDKIKTRWNVSFEQDRCGIRKPECHTQNSESQDYISCEKCWANWVTDVPNQYQIFLTNQMFESWEFPFLYCHCISVLWQRQKPSWCKTFCKHEDEISQKHPNSCMKSRRISKLELWIRCQMTYHWVTQFLWFKVADSSTSTWKLCDSIWLQVPVPARSLGIQPLGGVVPMISKWLIRVPVLEYFVTLFGYEYLVSNAHSFPFLWNTTTRWPWSRRVGECHVSNSYICS